MTTIQTPDSWPRPKLHGDLKNWGLIHADALSLLGALPDNSVSTVITDPPYALAFGGNSWDGAGDGRYLADPDGFQAFTTAWAREVRRVLMPGGYLVAHCAPRTFHRLVAGVEDTGLDVRDQLLWMFSSGVPKGRRYPGGLGSDLKPAYEPILLARAPLARTKRRGSPTLNGNIETYGTGGLNIEATRVPGAGNTTSTGYYPANMVLSHDERCAPADCTKTCPVPLIDRLGPDRARLSRILYSAKASRAEREAGCEHLPKRRAPVFSGKTSVPRANFHATVKPLDLERWLVRLTVPEGGVVLDPFTGSGSIGCAAVLEGRQFIGIERESEYLPIARARLAHWTKEARSSQGRPGSTPELRSRRKP